MSIQNLYSFKYEKGLTAPPPLILHYLQLPLFTSRNNEIKTLLNIDISCWRISYVFEHWQKQTSIFFRLMCIWTSLIDIKFYVIRWLITIGKSIAIDSPCDVGTVYPKKYAHGFVVLCFVVVMQSFIMNSHEVFIHSHQGCFAGTGAIVRLPQCQWSKPDGYGKISQCITTTKHSKAKTVCIFLGIYCTVDAPPLSCMVGNF